MRKLNSDSTAMKNIFSGVLLVGGLAAGIIGASIVAHANESISPNMQRTVRNKFVNDKQKSTNIEAPLIETEDDLVKLVIENGNQIMVDEKTGKMYLAYLNENNKVEVVEVTQDEVNDLINQVSRISNSISNTENEGSYIPREYLREVNNQPQKTGRKRLNSKEGRQAVERAIEHNKSNK